MGQQSDEEGLLRNYLLGVLDDKERERVEERLFDDDGFAASLSAAENGLIDDYVFKLLSPSERESFEQNFILTEERRRKMLFAQTLEIYVDERSGRQPSMLDPVPPPAPWWRNSLPLLRSYKVWLAVPALVLLLFFLMPKIVRWLKPPDQGALISKQRTNIERQLAEFNRHLADQRVQALPSYELTLQTQLRADRGIARVNLTPDIKLLTLKLMLPEVKREKYNALVLTVEDDELFAIEEITREANAPGVLLRIPSEFLTTSDYQIQLRGVADGQLDNPLRYYFRVIK